MEKKGKKEQNGRKKGKSKTYGKGEKSEKIKTK